MNDLRRQMMQTDYVQSEDLVEGCGAIRGAVNAIAIVAAVAFALWWAL